jgi:hypothetical protein
MPMRDNEAPTEASTRPEGNTSMRPSVLERGIGSNVAAKLREHHPEQNKRIREHLARKHSESGHARS